MTADRAEIADTVKAIQRNVRAERLRPACALMTRDVHLQLGQAGHGTASTCDIDLLKTLGLVQSNLKDRSSRVSRVTVDGDRATATLTLADGTTTAAAFQREDDKWKLSNIFGADTLPPKEVKAAEDAEPTLQTPAVVPAAMAGDPISGLAGTGRCSPGECEGRIVGGATTVLVRTVIGSFPLSVDCFPDARVVVDAEGRIRLDDMDWDTEDGTCGDTVPCTGADGRAAPWEGEIRAPSSGRLEGVLAICMATCVGRFKAETPFELVRADSGWRMRFEDAPLDAGTAVLDGDWRIKGIPQ